MIAERDGYGVKVIRVVEQAALNRCSCRSSRLCTPADYTAYPTWAPRFAKWREQPRCTRPFAEAPGVSVILLSCIGRTVRTCRRARCHPTSRPAFLRGEDELIARIVP